MRPRPAEPASSPVLVAILAPTLATGFPSIVTVSAPSAISLSIATLTYGIGTGPPGLGVLHTSGTGHVWVIPCPLCKMLRPLASTFLPMDSSFELLLCRDVALPRRRRAVENRGANLAGVRLAVNERSPARAARVRRHPIGREREPEHARRRAEVADRVGDQVHLERFRHDVHLSQ